MSFETCIFLCKTVFAPKLDQYLRKRNHFILLLLRHQAKLFSIMGLERVLSKVNTIPTITPKKINFVNRLNPGLSVGGATSDTGISACC